MKNITIKLAELQKNIFRVLGLGYEIDSNLVIIYYLTSALGAIAPVFAAYLFKLTLDTTLTASAVTLGQVSIPLLIIFSLAGYFFMNLIENVAYWGLNVNYYDYLLRNKLQAGLTYRYARKMSSLDLGYLEDPEIQNLVTKVEHTYTWQIPDFLRIFNYIFRDLVTVLSVIIAFGNQYFWMPIVIILITIPRVYFKLKNGNFVWSIFGGNAKESKKLWYVNDLLIRKSSIIETRIFQSQQPLLNKLKSLMDHLYSENKKPLDNYRWILILFPVIETIAILAIIYSIIPNVLSGIVTIGTFTFIITTLQQLRSAMAWSTSHFGEIYEKSLFVNPYFELINLRPLITENPHAKTFNIIKPPVIEFKNVSFRYPNGKNVLENINFRINPGESIALVGVNGAGKSTIIKLLCRFYDVSSGEILINGVDIKDLSLSNWYKFLGTLFQDFVRYNFTVRENNGAS